MKEVVTGEPSRMPPILRFTVRLLDASDLLELAEVCTHDMVELFGCLRAKIDDGEGIVSSHAAPVPSDDGVSLGFRLSMKGQGNATLTVSVPRGPDVPIVRQQFVDLVAVVRRAWRDRRLLTEERRRAREDALTGLDNRRSIEEFLARELTVEPALRRPLTIMLIDLDRFKQVNDTHGHQAGDDVLKLAATCFRAHLRPGDRVCRWGGDEFLVACPGLTATVATDVADRLRRAFREEPRSRGATMSIGIVHADPGEPGESVEILLARADHCLYAAKEDGRDCAHVEPESATVAGG